MENNKKNNDKLIRKSFEEMSYKAPEHVWENINTQLYIDNVWMNIDSKLDKIYSRKKRFVYLKYPAAAILLLSLLFSFYTLFRSEEILTANISITKQGPHNILSNLFEAKKKNFINKSTNHNVLKKEAEKNNTYSDIQNKNTLINLYSANNSTDNNYKLISSSTKTTDETPILNEILKNIDTMSCTKIPLINFSTFNNKIYTPELNFNEAETYINDDKNHIIQVGLLYSLNNTMIINQDLIENYRDESTITIDPSLASSYGLIIDIMRSPRSYFSSEFYFISNQKQFANLYSNGKYYKKGIELEYKKIVLSYKRLFSFKTWAEESDMFLKTGVYFSLLTSDDIYYMRNNIKTDFQYSSFYNYDYGLKISFGREMYFSRFSFGIGLQAEYGLMNIFKGNGTVPSYFNRTNNFSHGLFITFRHI